MKIKVLEDVRFTLLQTGEVVEYEAGEYEVKDDLNIRRIIEQSYKKIVLVKEKKGKK